MKLDEYMNKEWISIWSDLRKKQKVGLILILMPVLVFFISLFFSNVRYLSFGTMVGLLSLSSGILLLIRGFD